MQTIKYTPNAGPAFIWSVNFSAEGNRLAVACWNKSTFLYDVDPNAAIPERECTTPLTEICAVVRSDRVYSVGLDKFGHNMAVGGRDKRVAMFDCEHPGVASNARRDATLVWEVVSDDFVYAIALSEDMQTVGKRAAHACRHAR